MGNGEALLNRPRRWADTCAGFVPSRSAGRRAAVSACLFLGLCLPSVSGRRLASHYGLFNHHGALLSPCEQSHVPWPCCVGLDTLLSLALVELVALCLRWRAPIQVDLTLNPAAEVSPFGHRSGPRPGGQKWPFSVVAASFARGSVPSMKGMLACPSLHHLSGSLPRSCTPLLFLQDQPSRGHL